MKNIKESKQNSVFKTNKEKADNLLCGDFWESGVDSIRPLRVNNNSNTPKGNQNRHNGNEFLRWNRYNYIKKNSDNEYLLFNCSTNNHMYMIEKVKELIDDNRHSVNQIESKHPELYHFLKKKKFIVNDRFDEIEDAISQMKKSLYSSDCFELFINPTLDCNLKCWYCYESLQKKSIVNDDTLRSIMCFIRNKVLSKELKEITISFFGGEPLLGYHKVIWPIIEFTQKMCTENKKKCYFYFNTNGVLLSQKIVDQLYANGLCCAFQVPFDGNEEYHNKTKKYVNGKGTFDKIINNVMYALSQGFKFVIRCNYTSDNLHSFDELISIFTEYAGECIDYGLLTFAYHKVWQVNQTTEMENVVGKYEDRTIFLDTLFHNCYADKENSVFINFNGDVYNCSAIDFKPEDREGYLDGDGKIMYNEKHQKRMEVRYSNKNCLNCMIFPICTICSQNRLALQNKDVKCLRSFSEEDKERLLLKRIEIASNNNFK
jgi:uncharacterized protein